MEDTMTLGLARRIAGSLGFPTKMPGTSYGLPARACIAGKALAKIKGTACSVCYALAGRANYQWPRAQIGQEKRLKAISHPRWVEAMVRLLINIHSGPIRVDMGSAGVRAQRQGGSRIRYNEPGFHRWHDSGDLQSVDHLSSICEVARQTPAIKHWLPTQELGVVHRYVDQGGVIPSNLVIRVSAVMIDDERRRAWPQQSSVYRQAPLLGAFVCPAPGQEHQCRSCRACWSPDVPHVTYALH